MISSFGGSKSKGWTSDGAVRNPVADRNDQVADAEHVPGADEASVLLRVSRIGEADDGRHHTDEDVAHAGRPGEEAGQLAGGIEDQEDHAERAIELDADEPVLAAWRR